MGTVDVERFPVEAWRTGSTGPRSIDRAAGSRIVEDEGLLTGVH